MNFSIKLGGFKILNDLIHISLLLPENTKPTLTQFFEIIAKEKINLPYITCIRDRGAWMLNIAMDKADGAKFHRLLGESSESFSVRSSRSSILSIFPHRNNPEITGALFEALGKKGVETESFAHSPSAISVVIREELLNSASAALFGPFCFSAYRSPADWKLAQEGKEELYKEVVASYQEKKPKVYGLDCSERQLLLHLKLQNPSLGSVGAGFKGFAQWGLHLSFLISRHSQEEACTRLSFCLPQQDHFDPADKLKDLLPKSIPAEIAPAAVFSMNGPHFGDRYGITSELLIALERSGAELIALSCSIASVVGVLPVPQMDSAVQAILGCFDVPRVTRRGVNGQ